jgi:O-succinylbenzoate synthase
VGVHLASVEVIPYALPFKQPYVTARGTLTQREMVLLRLTTCDGLVGLGEAVPLSLRGGVSLAAVVRELEEVGASEALSDFFARGVLEVTTAEEMDPRLVLSPPSHCALITAVWDIYTQAIDLYEEPVPARPEPIRCNATLVAGEPAAVAAEALAWAAEGFSTFKLKLGTERDVEQVRAVREAVGPGAKIRIDANGAWPLPVAAERLSQLEPFDIELAEQPVATMEEAAQLARQTSIPLCGDESIVDPIDAFRAIETGAFAIAGIKASKVGGLFRGMEIAEAIPSYASSALDGPIGIALGARLADALRPELFFQSRPALAHGLATQRLFAATIAAVECELREGMLHPPSGPGLGVVIDEDALDAHRL